jgi:DNA-directed RNA polymerase specialized sigma24 family protein
MKMLCSLGIFSVPKLQGYYPLAPLFPGLTPRVGGRRSLALKGRRRDKRSYANRNRLYFRNRLPQKGSNLTTDQRIDETFRQARLGDGEAFAAWMGMVEIPLRRSLQRYARAVDVEVVVQETLVRMWIFALDPKRELTGDHASLRFAHRVARNVALEEMRRYRRDNLVELETLEGLAEGQIAAEMPDPALARAIEDCLDRLPAQPRSALSARLRDGSQPDRELATRLRMKGNTFLQNIVRARKLLRNCLEERGVRLAEILS